MDYQSKNVPPIRMLFTVIFAVIYSMASHSKTVATSTAMPGYSHQDWHKLMTQTAHAAAGCFIASYPDTAWNPVTCIAGSRHPFRLVPKLEGLRQNATVGNGTDFSAQVSSGTISQAVGTFPVVTNVTTETDGNANVFSLQLNTQVFNTAACNGVSGCRGWQQFIYSTTTIGGAFMQYWLLNYGPTCPSGWIASSGSCFRNSSIMPVPAQTVAALQSLSLTGMANSAGLDTVILSTGTTLYRASGQDSVLNLSQGWTQAEFNIFGDGGSIPTATFNAGATLLVNTNVSNGTTNAPVCAGGGFTFEGNNLSLVNPCCPYGGATSGIAFRESNVTIQTQSCAILEHPLAWLPVIISQFLQ